MDVSMRTRQGKFLSIYPKLPVLLVALFIGFLFISQPPLCLAGPGPSCTLTVDQTHIEQAGELVVLSWTTKGADWVEINQGIGSVALSGSLNIYPAATTEYMLIASDARANQAYCRVTVDVGPYPPTVSISASPATITAGKKSTLIWASTYADTVSIDNGIGTVAASGSVDVFPTSTTAYKINASGAGGTTSANTTVTVVVLPASPKNLISRNLSTGSIYTSWTAPPEPVTVYRVYRRTGTSTYDGSYITTTMSNYDDRMFFLIPCIVIP
jgi:hypothetical protein